MAAFEKAIASSGIYAAFCMVIGTYLVQTSSPPAYSDHPHLVNIEELSNPLTYLGPKFR